MTAPVAALVLRAARRVVARAAAEGGGAPELSLDRIAAWLEAAPAAGGALEGGGGGRARRDMPEADAGTGPAAARRARADEVHHAVHALRLAGELAAEEPDRLQLPGFGPSTWRAIGILREGDRGPAGGWAAAVADLPLPDLGGEAPPRLARPAAVGRGAAGGPGTAQDGTGVNGAGRRVSLHRERPGHRPDRPPHDSRLGHQAAVARRARRRRNQ